MTETVCSNCFGCGQIIKTGDDEWMPVSEFDKMPFQVTWAIRMNNKPYTCPMCKGSGKTKDNPPQGDSP